MLWNHTATRRPFGAVSLKSPVQNLDLRFSMTSMRSLLAFIKIDAVLIVIIFDISLHATTTIATNSVLAKFITTSTNYRGYHIRLYHLVID